MISSIFLYTVSVSVCSNTTARIDFGLALFLPNRMASRFGLYVKCTKVHVHYCDKHSMCVSVVVCVQYQCMWHIYHFYWVFLLLLLLFPSSFPRIYPLLHGRCILSHCLFFCNWCFTASINLSWGFSTIYLFVPIWLLLLLFLSFNSENGSVYSSLTWWCVHDISARRHWTICVCVLTINSSWEKKHISTHFAHDNIVVVVFFQRIVFAYTPTIATHIYPCRCLLFYYYYCCYVKSMSFVANDYDHHRLP